MAWMTLRTTFCFLMAYRLALALSSPEDEPCSNAVAEERRLHAAQLAEIHAIHADAIRELTTQLRDRNRDLEVLRRTCLPESRADVVPSSPASASSGHRSLLPSVERARRRQRLRSGSEAGHCSKEELQAVLDLSTADPTGDQRAIQVVLNILTENPPCGVCTIKLGVSGGAPLRRCETHTRLPGPYMTAAATPQVQTL